MSIIFVSNKTNKQMKPQADKRILQINIVDTSRFVLTKVHNYTTTVVRGYKLIDNI